VQAAGPLPPMRFDTTKTLNRHADEQDTCRL
jgi:hypothetical protein